MMATDYQNQAALLLKEFTLPATLIPCLSITCGIFACKKIYDISRLISSAFIKVYSGLSRKQQIEWNNRVISTVHAIFITIMSVYLTFWSDLYTDNETTGLLIFQNSALSSFVLGVSIGYFLFDLGMIFWFYPTLGGMEYVLHHLLSMSALVYAMLFGEGQFYVYLVLISETTTPSINLRWYLDVVGLRRSKAYVVNGVVIFFTWLVARILLFMYLFYHLITHYDQMTENVHVPWMRLIMIDANRKQHRSARTADNNQQTKYQEETYDMYAAWSRLRVLQLSPLNLVQIEELLTISPLLHLAFTTPCFSLTWL